MAKKAKDGAIVEQTIVEDRPDGERHVHHVFREWHPHAPESLRQIESIIDSWGGRTAAVTSYDPAPELHLDLADVERRVDKLTKRVKGHQKVTVEETVTEWVERPVEEAEAPAEDAWEEPAGAPVEEPEVVEEKPSRPKRRFRALGFIGKKSKDVHREKKAKAASEPKADHSDPDYQPQCAALTADGAQCRNSARHGSKYCISHFGYQPPTLKGLAQRIEGDAWDPEDDLTDRDSAAAVDTLPAVAKAKDTRLRTRKPARRGKSSKKR